MWLDKSWVLVVLIMISTGTGCLTSMEHFTGQNFVSMTQLCVDGRCTDSSEEIRAVMNEYHLRKHGHPMVVPILGSVVGANANLTCQACGQNTLMNFKEWHTPFNPNNDEDDRPHRFATVVCSNSSCARYNSNQEVPGSLQPIEGEADPNVQRVGGHLVIMLPGSSPAPGTVPSLAPGVGVRVPAGGFSPVIPRVWFPGMMPGMVPVPAP